MKTLKEIRELQKPWASGWFKVNYEIGSVIVYKLQKYDFSPNWITLLGVILSIIIGILIVKQHYFFGGILVALSYLTDNIDGQWARLKKRCTKIGALLDGTADKTLWLVIVLSILFSNFSRVNSLMVIGIISLKFMSQSSTYSCRLIHYSSHQKGLFISEIVKGKGIIRFIRVMIGKFFAHNTFFLIVSLLLILNLVKWFFIYELVRQVVVMIGISLVVIRLTKEEMKELSVKKGCR